jgi:C-terminal processing protease CtpA/Prc
MIRFTVAMSSVLLGSLISSPSAISQEPSKAETAAKERVVETNAASKPVLIDLETLIDQDAEAVGGQDDPAKNPVAQKLFRARTYTAQTPIYHTATLATTFDALETNFGLKLDDADDPLRAQLELPPDQGVVVISIKPGSLAEHAGLKTNDVFLSLGDQKATNAEVATKTLLGLGKGTLEVKLIREGKPSRMTLVGPEHGFPPESAQFWIGVPVSPVDATLRSHLPSLSTEAGLIVNDVVKGSPAETAGVQKSDILVSMAGKPLKTADQLIEQIQASAGKPVPLEILRAGKPMTLTVTAAKRTHPTTINLPGTRDTQYRWIAPHLGVETRLEPKEWTFHHLNPPNLTQALPPGGMGPIDVQLHLRGTQGNAQDSTARIEAQLAEMSGKLEEIRKLLVSIKKLEEK